MKEFRLPKTFTEKWIEALRSDKFKQTESVLYDKEIDSYCAIGVACVANGMRAVEIENRASVDLYLAKKCGVPRELASEGMLAYEIMKLNDTDQASFKGIAEWIEDNVELEEEAPLVVEEEEVELALVES